MQPRTPGGERKETDRDRPTNAQFTRLASQLSADEAWPVWHNLRSDMLAITNVLLAGGADCELLLDEINGLRHGLTLLLERDYDQKAGVRGG